VLFPTITFTLFFVVVLPASWLLMPRPRRRRASDVASERSQPWLAVAATAAAAALLGPLSPLDGGPTPVRVLLWGAAVALGASALARWAALRGLVRWQVFALGASYVFYGSYDWRFVGLIIASTLVNQIVTTVMARADADAARRAWLTLAVVLNLGVLGWFKYKGFFLESASGVLAPLGIDVEPPGRTVLPPVGISFFTFQALSYVIDVYRRRLQPVPLLEFGVFLAFFPQVVAGPIVRASEFLPQLRTPRDARRVDTGLAFWLIAAGLFKKVVVSSYLADAAADPVFRLPGQHQAVDTLIGVYAYAIQIYCDFSGYTDMAIGIALLLGFRFPQNFNAPYTAASLQDFWRRWHMTLSRWLRDYLYVPLGGNRRGPNRAYLNVLLTMLIGGLWHGAAWTFVVWGALHGSYLAGERWWAGRTRTPPGADPDLVVPGPPATALAGPDATSSANPLDPATAMAYPSAGSATATVDGTPVGPVSHPHLPPATRLWLGRLLTFHVVCLGWVFFRAPSVSEALAVLGRLTSFGTGTGINLVVVATIVAFLATQFVPSDRVGRAQAAFSRLQPWQQGGLLAAWLMVTSALSPAGVAPFIYFQF
jgi:alginate O-acetyltransferase complex protein AlgI